MRWNVWAFATVVAVTSLGGWACNHTDYMTGAPGGGGGGGGVTVGAFVTVGYGGANVFNPTAVTITHGESLVFYYASGFHTADVNDGTNTGTCHSYNFESSTAGDAVTQVFTTAGTFPFYCEVHGSCSSGCLGGPCSGMTGNVVVQ